MKNIIIGTAGHVDHGKTCLIKALTGIDTDRLIEEKKRGITIDIGFAFLDLPGGDKAGIVDVPGHGKFIKNMLAGASGMDMVLFVVAADEGVMPQTREHLGILSLLDVQNGIVVITKSDLVDEEMMELVRYDLQCELKGTFLEHAPVLQVSAFTGEGIDLLKAQITKIVQSVHSKDVKKTFRLPIDRVFVMDGFGTVLTGTLAEGSVAAGDEVAIFPGNRKAKVRKIQVHGENVEKAEAGQRVALNLSAVKKEEIMRGDTLGAPESMRDTLMLDVRLSVMNGASRSIQSASTLHLYHETRHTLCKAVLLDRDTLEAGKSCYAQLRLNEPIAAKTGDHFIVRFYSPVETIGGGVVLESNPVKHKRMDPPVLEGLAIKEKGSLEEKILQVALEHSAKLETARELSRRLFISEEELEEEAGKLADLSKLVFVGRKIIVHESYLADLQKRLILLLEQYHELNPLQAGMRKDELKGRLLPEADAAAADGILDIFAERGIIHIEGQRAALGAFQIIYSDAQKKIAQEVSGIYAQGGYSVPNLDDVQQGFSSASDREIFKQVLQSMLDSHTLVCISPQIFLHKDHFLNALKVMREIQAADGEISLGALRDRLSTSRKYAYAFLEYCDRNKITKRTGDLRRLTGREDFFIE